jgi:hypothetical protein
MTEESGELSSDDEDRFNSGVKRIGEVKLA